MSSEPTLLGIGTPSITEAPAIRVAWNGYHVSVWVQGVGYLDRSEREALAQFILRGGSS